MLHASESSWWRAGQRDAAKAAVYLRRHHMYCRGEGRDTIQSPVIRHRRCAPSQLPPLMMAFSSSASPCSQLFWGVLELQPDPTLC